MARPTRAPFAAALAAALLVALTPAAAHADMVWSPCQPAGFECGKLAVPLDPSGSAPGFVDLAATRRRAADNPTRTALVTLAGGPGQAALPLVPDFGEALAPALAHRDLLVFDQRGTGSSEELRCNALSRPARTLADAVEACANEIGPARQYFTTAQSVADLEELRIAAGYDKLALYGVSYGTKVALAYAAAHPDHVESLVLDSVVTPEGPDAFQRSSLLAIPRVLRELCEKDECKGITPNVVADLSKLAAKIHVHALRGPVYSGFGRKVRVTVDQVTLDDILLAGDLNPTLRAELPGSMRAALTGDVKPLLRLGVRSEGLADRAGYQASSADSDATFFTTTCEESSSLPWTRGASRAQRTSEVVSAAKALNPAVTAPFSREIVLDGIPRLCLGYPVAGPPPASPGPLPAVPTLVLDGQADLRTPLEDAQAVASRIPGATVVAVPHTGHSVLGSDTTKCARAAAAAFYGAQPAHQCPATENPFSPTPRPPKRLSSLDPLHGTHGLSGRTLRAVRDSVTDANRQVIGEALALGAQPAGVGGLRGGYVRVTSDALDLHGYQYVPGVSVTGKLRSRGTSTFRVRGSAAAHGTIEVTEGGRVSGTLDGHKVHTSYASAAAVHPRFPLTLREAIARGRLARAGR